VALLIMIAFWTWLWGPIGLVLATPLTVCLMVISKSVPGLQFINLLLGNEPALDPHHVFYHRLVARNEEEAREVAAKVLETRSRADFFDKMLIPALVSCRQDHKRGRITAQDQNFIFEAVRRQIDNQRIVPTMQIPGLTGKPAPRRLEPPADRSESPSILGCPASDESDELALLMLSELLAAEQWQMRVLSSGILSSECLAELGKEQKSVVCVGTLSEGSMVPTRQFCRRIRSQFPQLPVVLGCWGQGRHRSERVQRPLLGITNATCYSLGETKNHVIQFAQLEPEPTVSEPGVAVVS